MRADGVPSTGSRTFARDIEWMLLQDDALRASWGVPAELFLRHVNVLVVVLPLLAAAVALLPRPPRGGPAELVCLLWGCVLLLGPVGWPWYAINAAPFLGLLLRRPATTVTVALAITAWAVTVDTPPQIVNLPSLLLYWLPCAAVALTGCAVLSGTGSGNQPTVKQGDTLQDPCEEHGAAPNHDRVRDLPGNPTER